jgi:uncharacterized membrane protein YgcG
MRYHTALQLLSDDVLWGEINETELMASTVMETVLLTSVVASTCVVTAEAFLLSEEPVFFCRSTYNHRAEEVHLMPPNNKSRVLVLKTVFDQAFSARRPNSGGPGSVDGEEEEWEEDEEEVYRPKKRGKGKGKGSKGKGSKGSKGKGKVGDAKSLLGEAKSSLGDTLRARWWVFFVGGGRSGGGGRGDGWWRGLPDLQPAAPLAAQE